MPGKHSINIIAILLCIIISFMQTTIIAGLLNTHLGQKYCSKNVFCRPKKTYQNFLPFITFSRGNSHHTDHERAPTRKKKPQSLCKWKFIFQNDGSSSRAFAVCFHLPSRAFASIAVSTFCNLSTFIRFSPSLLFRFPGCLSSTPTNEPRQKPPPSGGKNEQNLFAL